MTFEIMKQVSREIGAFFLTNVADLLTRDFTTILLLTISLILTIFGIYKTRIDIISTDWPSTIGKVSSHGCSRFLGDIFNSVIYRGHDYWVPYLVLSYFVEGQKYLKKTKTGKKYRRRKITDFLNKLPVFTKEEVLAKTHESYPINSEFPKPISYNPTQPSHSTLDPGFKSWRIFFPVSALVLFFIAEFNNYLQVSGWYSIAYQESTTKSNGLFEFLHTPLLLIIPILVFLSFRQIFFGYKGSLFYRDRKKGEERPIK